MFKDLPRGWWIYVAVLVPALTCFLVLASMVSGHNGLTAYDRDTARSLNEYGVTVPGLTSFFRVYTELGSKEVLTVIFGLVGVVLAYRKQPMFGVFLFLFFLAGLGLNLLIKEWVARPRPEYAHLASYSFPSGHTSAALIGYGLLSYLVLVKIERRSVALTIVAGLTFVAVLVGYSRMYLLVHWFSDVIGSLMFSSAWLVVSIAFLELVRGRQQVEERARPDWNLMAGGRGFQGSRNF